MTDLQGDINVSDVKQAPLASYQNGQAQNIAAEQMSSDGNTTQTNTGSRTEAQEEAIKDQIDGAIPSGPKRADQSTGGRVQVGETGDLHDLAARRQS
ncbi:hypothetical protein F5Y14DRAFT_430460 [Nemania sp. NC0429]|nr:hypothetical protein F5Y14DRAFT_430460 [Nemania sp. NC0429]